ncbi:phage minor head protein [Psychromonas sp. MME2]|uniref:phage minor head protein n=1 Tax=unclassified Psychromonas TaxID=2614957 RepID=UPI00339BA24C
MSSARYGSLPFKEQIDFFRAKLNISTEAWDDIWGNAHNSAFMVAGAMENDLLNSFRKAVDIAISEGKGIGWFKSEFNEIVKKNGWQHTGNKDWRARIIYNTNLRQSYNAGRWAQLQQFEFWQYQHGDSFNPRIQHKAWHGLTLPRDDSFWQTHFPSNGWGCKCKVSGKRKGTDDKAPDIELVDYIDKKTGEVIKVPKGIDPSFDYAPHASEQLTRQKQKLIDSAVPYQTPERIVPTAFSSVEKVDIHRLNDVLDKLMLTDAAPQIQLLSAFIKKNNRKTLFIKESEMTLNAQAALIANDVAKYLDVEPMDALKLFTVRRANKPLGFTRADFQHIVINTFLNADLKKVNTQAILDDVKLIIQQGIMKKGRHHFDDGDERWYAFAEAGGDLYDNEAVFLTWLHEMGHQVHYKLGVPERPTDLYLTRYANKDSKEWFAEHFTAYVLDRNELNNHWPDIVAWFDNMMEKLNE